MVNKDEATKAAHVLWEYIRQFEDKPLVYQQSNSTIIAIRIQQINDMFKHMKKSYKREIKRLKKEGRITYVNDTEFYYND